MTEEIEPAESLGVGVLDVRVGTPVALDVGELAFGLGQLGVEPGPLGCGECFEPVPKRALPHTAVSLWVAAGASDLEVAKWAGHRSAAFTKSRYAHLFPEHGEALADRLDAFIAASMPTPEAAIIDLGRFLMCTRCAPGVHQRSPCLPKSADLPPLTCSFVRGR